jgi:hypothetical protein
VIETSGDADVQYKKLPEFTARAPKVIAPLATPTAPPRIVRSTVPWGINGVFAPEIPALSSTICPDGWGYRILLACK